MSLAPLEAPDRPGSYAQPPVPVDRIGRSSWPWPSPESPPPRTTQFRDHLVGTEYRDGLAVSSTRSLKPLGDRLMTKYGKFMGSTVSPDGRFLAASQRRQVRGSCRSSTCPPTGWSSTVGTASASTRSSPTTPSARPARLYSPDGSYLWMSQKDGLTRFPVNADGTLGTPTSVPLAKVGAASALPGKPAYSADGSTLYAPVNGQNTVEAIDPTTGAVEQTWNVGIAPREIAVVGSKLYVSNEGGRPAQAGESTINSYGTQVPADPQLGTSTTGTVSVIDTSAPAAAVTSVPVGLHPTALYVQGTTLFVANTNSDTVSVIDTTSDHVVQTIATQPWPASQVGYEPTGLAVTGDHLLVTLGRANAVAVYGLNGSAQAPVRLVGLLPTDYFPTDIAVAGGQVVVTNTRGIDARGPSSPSPRAPARCRRRATARTAPRRR